MINFHGSRAKMSAGRPWGSGNVSRSAWL